MNPQNESGVRPHLIGPGAGTLLGATALLLLLAGLCGAGCAHLGVQPWERDQLSRPEMQIGADPVESSLDDHLYFSTEASSGGRGVGGGGCGCN